MAPASQPAWVADRHQATLNGPSLRYENSSPVASGSLCICGVPGIHGEFSYLSDGPFRVASNSATSRSAGIQSSLDGISPDSAGRLVASRDMGHEVGKGVSDFIVVKVEATDMLTAIVENKKTRIETTLNTSTPMFHETQQGSSCPKGDSHEDRKGVPDFIVVKVGTTLDMTDRITAIVRIKKDDVSAYSS
ncbi:hypothetical protein K439DRAFT_1610968 [Ramaria rubella]|nr:hypothetical protein K439DRAFT_1610968 [Ramaria rubella]